MITIQQAIVEEHLDELRRDAELVRAARRLHRASPDSDEDVGAALPPRVTGRRPVRLRLGLWLISLGNAVAGGRPDGASRRPA